MREERVFAVLRGHGASRKSTRNGWKPELEWKLEPTAKQHQMAGICQDMLQYSSTRQGSSAGVSFLALSITEIED
jgi:hypothetical protein